jgi:hypothetical protein
MGDTPDKRRATFSAHLMRDTLARLEALAKVEKRSFSNMVQVLLDEALDARNLRAPQENPHA